MTDYTELVKALRCCGNVNTDCTVCPWDKYNFGLCAEKLCTDTAAAIEALEAEVKELKRVNMEIFEDLPKRGEWIETEEKEWGIYPFKKKTCSVCDCKIDHVFMLACMDYFDDMDTVFHYCPNCGAKMEVQE